MAYVYLCSIPEIDNSYINVMNFSSKSALQTFMQNRTLLNIGEVNVKYDGSIPVIDIAREYGDLLNVDYVWIHSVNPTTDTYYFVTRKEIRATAVTRLYLELDVFMTYQFRMTFQTCLIERQHEYRWLQDGNPNMERLLVSENLPLFNYMTNELSYKPGIEVFAEGNKIRTDLGTMVYTTSSPLDMTTEEIDTPDDTGQTVVTTDCIASNGDIYTYPTTGTITAGNPYYPESFGGGKHYGIDIANKQGTPVYAPYQGTVVKVDKTVTSNTYPNGAASFGTYVVVNCDDQGNGETYHLFGHLSKVNVTEGQKVFKTTKLGEMGNTGYSSGPHLHWEVSPNGKWSTSNYISGDKDVNSKIGDVID